jgi:tetratricopeptide (TPR) repeat protein
LVEVLGRTTEPEQFKAAIDGLWSLWFSERGSENKAKLEAVDRLISEGEASQWVEASAAARELAEEHDDWPEALNRLATVEYLRGEYDTSVELCKKVLAAKIHHFGALSGICMCYQKLGDEEALAEWRERMLPNDPSARRRWADRAIRALDRLDG